MRSISENKPHIYNNLLETIGCTPVVRLPNLKKKYDIKADIMAKLEFFNPLSSVKDRIGLSMIEAAEKEGKIVAGKTTLIEATAGNTGIGLAFVAAQKGYKLIVLMPESMSIERRKILTYFGVEVILTPAEIGMAGTIERAYALAEEIGDAYIFDQFSNQSNLKVHEETTGPEIWHDTEGKIDIIIVGSGTGGTVTGVSRFLKSKNPDIQTVVVEPAHSAFLSGEAVNPHRLQGIGNSFMPDILDTSIIDEILKVDEEKCFEMAREVARLEGIPAGISSGAMLLGLVEVASRPENEGKTILTFCPSSAERYISTDLFK